HCAARYGERCVAAVVESAPAYIGDETLAGIRQAREAFRQQDQFARLERFHGEKSRWVLSAWVDTWLSPQFAHWSLEAVLPLMRCPALVIHGSEDDFGSVRHPETIARLAGGPVELEIMEGVRHVPHRETEPQVMDLVTRFLAHCP
ncbi:MAG TPA: alpha/beta hydrolase, partial [Telluria sp.]|nr:alpha/beta hydrolase [Telluria sp.]